MLVKQLFEAPIEDITMLGNWEKNSSFRDPIDRKLLSNTKAQAKIIQKWIKTIVPFNIYFINSPEAGRHAEVGAVSNKWLQTNMPKTLPDLDLRDDAINVLFTNNKGAERVPMTGWIMAHRFGHVVRNEHGFAEAVLETKNTIKNIMDEVYGKRKPRFSYGSNNYEDVGNYERMIIKFYEIIGTFKSAREGNLRNDFEFYYELLAQYMTSGSIKFNPLPRNFGYGKMAWGRHTRHAVTIHDQENHDSFEDALPRLASELNDTFEQLMHECVGKIFVM